MSDMSDSIASLHEMLEPALTLPTDQEWFLVRRDILQLALDIINELQAEIARHHRDFERWEDMADKGAQRIEEVNRLRTQNEELLAQLERLRH